MAQLTTTTTMHAPVERVFEICSDVGKAAERIRGIERVEVLTDGPVAEGTRFRETRIFFNREATEEMEFTWFDPPRGYCVENRSHGAHYLSTFEFTPRENGTEVLVTFEARPESFFARIMSVFSGAMLKSVLKCIDDDLADLKRIAEEEPA